MEETCISSNTVAALVPISGFLYFFSHQMMSIRASLVQEYLSSFWSSLQQPRAELCESSKPARKPSFRRSMTSIDGGESTSLRGEEVEEVMGALGLRCGEGGSKRTKLQQVYGQDEVAKVFEEREPSLEEVEEAFDVFDGNRDGFIDAAELQRVLCRLGFREGREVEVCERMIGVFDENGDGKIDFQEFVKLMENSSF